MDKILPTVNFEDTIDIIEKKVQTTADLRYSV